MSTYLIYYTSSSAGRSVNGNTIMECQPILFGCDVTRLREDIFNAQNDEVKAVMQSPENIIICNIMQLGK